MSQTNRSFILVDASYFCFYRYYSLVSWWKRAHPDEPLEDPYENAIFVEKFKSLFDETMKGLWKNLDITKEEYINTTIIIGRDCKREDIWRKKLFADYKANRNYDDFKGRPFFKMVFEEELFIKGGAKKILFHPHLEADDCIAITTKYLLKTYETSKIYIITSDKDYLQLIEPRVKIFDLAFKNIALKKSSTGDPKCDVFCKIVTGDISDNIPSIFKKCGIKTALKYYHDQSLFLETIKTEKKEAEFELNKTLIDFSRIPEELITEFYNQNSAIL